VETRKGKRGPQFNPYQGATKDIENMSVGLGICSNENAAAPTAGSRRVIPIGGGSAKKKNSHPRRERRYNRCLNSQAPPWAAKPAPRPRSFRLEGQFQRTMSKAWPR